jgi:hypothetical protein
MTTAAHTNRQKLLSQSAGLLAPVVDDGVICWLELVGDSGVTVDWKGGDRPWQVTWECSGDRKVRGEWRVVCFERTRSFAKVESLFKFLGRF